MPSWDLWGLPPSGGTGRGPVGRSPHGQQRVGLWALPGRTGELILALSPSCVLCVGCYFDGQHLPAADGLLTAGARAALCPLVPCPSFCITRLGPGLLPLKDQKHQTQEKIPAYSNPQSNFRGMDPCGIPALSSKRRKPRRQVCHVLLQKNHQC